MNGKVCTLGRCMSTTLEPQTYTHANTRPYMFLAGTSLWLVLLVCLHDSLTRIVTPLEGFVARTLRRHAAILQLLGSVALFLAFPVSFLPDSFSGSFCGLRSWLRGGLALGRLQSLGIGHRSDCLVPRPRGSWPRLRGSWPSPRGSWPLR